MRYLRMVWRFMTLDDRPMDWEWRPVEPEPFPCEGRKR